MSSPERDWPRLAAAVVHRRRSELHLDQDDIAARGGPSPATIRKIESGTDGVNYSPATISNLERALEWEAGSVEAVLSGGEPTPIGPVRRFTGGGLPAGGTIAVGLPPSAADATPEQIEEIAAAAKAAAWRLWREMHPDPQR